VDIGIGLPNPVPGIPGRRLVEWARRAEDLGFSSLATIDRVAYPSFESLNALAAAGAVTERVGLITNILLGPTRDPVLLAKEAASVDQISGGRLTLGLGVGTRPDDYAAAHQPFKHRGRRLDEALDLMHRAWKGELVEGAMKPVSPTPVRDGRVPILGGGRSDRAIERTVRWGIGWTAGGSAADIVGPFAQRVREAWKEAGREGEPRIVCLAYFALGDGAEEAADAYLTDYYGDYGVGMAARIPKTHEALAATIESFRESGADELIFDPTIGELQQVDLLAKAVL
jgi:alkanesulfonate monooxygenase SsuD/methylene tetrahydromethanopterin reductase-like flavin-dependent oxidoreductase (luciferase family)